MRYYYLIILIFTLVGCHNEEFETPPLQTNTNLPSGTKLEIRLLKNSLDKTSEQPILEFDISDQYLEGYVISSDRQGNFFKEIIIQDAYKNPTAGVQILVDERALYERYPVGTKLRIALHGLAVGYQNGVFQLGLWRDNSIQPIGFSAIDKHIFRTSEKNEIIPKKITVSQIGEDTELLRVQFDNMQFAGSLIYPQSKSFAAEVSDKFDAFRMMHSCDKKLDLVLASSTFSGFKHVSLPSGNGSVQGIVERDFGDDFYVLKINSVADIDFSQEDRCTITYFECDSSIENGDATVIFKEDFEAITNESKLEPLGWVNVNVTGDEKRWQDRKVTNVDNRTMHISAFNSNLQPLEAWLITPEFDLSNLSNPVFSVRIRTRFNNGKALRVWVTTDFSSDPLTTPWEELGWNIPTSLSNFVTFSQTLSCLDGKVRIGFQYKGFDPVITSTYEIDDVQLISE